MPDHEAGIMSFAHLNASSAPEDFVQYGRFLSELHALPDGTPTPPKAQHIHEASKAGIGPSMHAIDVVMGGIGKMQKEVGFVMPLHVNDWTEEDYIENGLWLSHMLGSPESPVMPTGPDIQKASLLFLAPSPERIRKVFGGSLDNYQDRLGFVNDATLKRWTDEEWIQNGQWLSHNLGSPDEPKIPSQADMNLASRLRVGPSEKAIYKKYGSLLNYQKALGFQPKEKLLDYDNWGRETFVENGKWLSHVLGTPESPKMPSKKDIELATRFGLCPPESAILKRFRKGFTQYQDALGFVTKHTLSRWEEADWIEHGKWASHVIGGSPQTPKPPGYHDLRNGASVHVSPSDTEVRKRFGSLANYQAKLGFENEEHAKRTLSNREILRRGLTLLRQRKGSEPLSMPDIQSLCGLSRTSIKNRFGGRLEFNEILGRTVFDEWDPERTLKHGVLWALQNEGNPPTYRMLVAEHQRYAGPSYKKVASQFGSWANYAAAVEEGLEIYNACSDKLDKLLSEELVAFKPHILKGFKADETFVFNVINDVTILNSLSAKGVPLARFLKQFGNSSHTVWWEKEDFIDYGKNAFKGCHINVSALQERLHALRQLRLAPRFEEIQEVFGSIDDYLCAVVSSVGANLAKAS